MKTLIIGLLAAASLAAALPAAAQTAPQAGPQAAPQVATQAASQAVPSTIPQREQRQQQRIDQGVKTGELTPRETRHLERREASIHRQARIMRARHGGRLTAYDRHVLNRRLARASHAIYVKKHDGVVR